MVQLCQGIFPILAFLRDGCLHRVIVFFHVARVNLRILGSENSCNNRPPPLQRPNSMTRFRSIKLYRSSTNELLPTFVINAAEIDDFNDVFEAMDLGYTRSTTRVVSLIVSRCLTTPTIFNFNGNRRRQGSRSKQLVKPISPLTLDQVLPPYTANVFSATPTPLPEASVRRSHS